MQIETTVNMVASLCGLLPDEKMVEYAKKAIADADQFGGDLPPIDIFHKHLDVLDGIPTMFADILHSLYSYQPTKIEYDKVKALLDKMTFNYRVDGMSTFCYARLHTGFLIGEGKATALSMTHYDTQLGKDAAKRKAIANATDNIFSHEAFVAYHAGTTLFNTGQR